MRLLLAGGGTAGHITPAIAVAEELLKKSRNSDILFIGRNDGNENRIIESSGFELKTLRIKGLKRSLSPENIKRIRDAFTAKRDAEEIIREFKPDVVLGTGGYVCWPVLAAAKKLGIPTAIHESNAFPGLTTRLLAKSCDRVFLGVGEAKKYLGKGVRSFVVGNPLRQDFVRTSRCEARRSLNLKENDVFILSFGGSIGAEKLNETIGEVMKIHSSRIENLKHLHGCGQRYYDDIESEFKGKGKSGCRIIPYINNMPTMLRAADIVICRSGAMTLSEIAQVGVASILIPSPNVSGNHQLKNAIHLSHQGAAIMIEEDKLSADLLINHLSELENDKNGRKNRAKILHTLSTPNAAKLIVEELFLLKNTSKRAVF